MVGREPSSRQRLHAMLTGLDLTALSALLREVGIVLYNREIFRWRVLMDISDELLDEATAPARRRITERFVDKTRRRA